MMKKIITYNYLNIQSMELHTEKKKNLRMLEICGIFYVKVIMC